MEMELNHDTILLPAVDLESSQEKTRDPRVDFLLGDHDSWR